MHEQNGHDMRNQIAKARAAVEAKLGVPLLGQPPKASAQVIITLQADGQVNFAASGDEIVTRFLLAKGAAIYEMILAQQTAAMTTPAKEK